jgi:hypothetical protein
MGLALLWDVVVLGFRINATLPPRKLVERVLAISETEARDFVKRLPRVARAGLSRADADKLLAALQTAGAKVELREHVLAQAIAPTKAPSNDGVVREAPVIQRAHETRLINRESALLAEPHEQAGTRAALTLRAGGAGEGAAALDLAAHAAVALARSDAPATQPTLMASATPVEKAPDKGGEERWSSHVRIKSLFPDDLNDDPAAGLSFSLPPVAPVEPVLHAEPTPEMLHAAAAHEFGGLDLRPFLPAPSAAYDEVRARAKDRARPSAPEPKANVAPAPARVDSKRDEFLTPELDDEQSATAPESSRAGSGRSLRVVLVAGSLLFALLALYAVLSR